MILSYAKDCPKLGRDVFVAENATVLGKVTIGDNSSIWYGSVIRGDVGAIHIGSRTNIQDLSLIHVTTDEHDAWIGDDVTVGHKALLHGCTIGEGALIGIQAVVLNGAVIGKNCLIGAGALVKEGAEIPDNSLVVGAPARVIRELNDKAIAALKDNAQGYVEKARLHRTRLARIG